MQACMIRSKAYENIRKKFVMPGNHAYGRSGIKVGEDWGREREIETGICSQNISKFCTIPASPTNISASLVHQSFAPNAQYNVLAAWLRFRSQ